MAFWKVITLWTEDADELECEKERTRVVEKDFDGYWDMREYVSAAVSHGCVGGMVFKHDVKQDFWWYYMEVC